MCLVVNAVQIRSFCVLTYELVDGEGGWAGVARFCRSPPTVPVPAALRPVRIGFTAMLSGRLPDCAGSTACRPADAILRDVASAPRSAIGLRAG